jgi:RNA polymerase sigma-70 factor (ECF subfamily)
MPDHNRFSVYSDEELMLLITQGEVEAFDAIYYRYSQRLMVYFTRMFNYDRLLAEDALQDLFLKIAESPQKFDRSRSFKTWIYSVASNSCKNHYRHLAVVNNCHKEISYSIREERHDQLSELLSRLDGPKFDQLLNVVLGHLPPEKKEAFLLRYQEEKSISEIALIQNCPEGSVKSRLHYTLKILEDKLKQFNPAI